jgi:hypothetical protein
MPFYSGISAGWKTPKAANAGLGSIPEVKSLRHPL